MKTNTPRVAELLLEQLALGEIDPADERWLRSQLDAGEIERRVAALLAANETFNASHEPERVLSAIAGRVRVVEAKREADARSRGSLRYLLPSLAVAAGALLWIAQPSGREGEGTQVRPPETILIKGLSPHLVVYRRVGEHADILGDGAHATRGDMLQVGYVAAQAKHGAIVSIDGAGAVTLHFPDSEAASTQLESQGEQLLLHAYELDAAPTFERFVFVTADRPIDVGKVLAAARAISRAPAAQRTALALPPGLAQHNLTLLKE